jgi:hypothetical protein
MRAHIELRNDLIGSIDVAVNPQRNRINAAEIGLQCGETPGSR